MDNSTIAIGATISVLTVLGFAAIIVWAVTQGTKPHLPEGTTHTLNLYGCIVRVEAAAAPLGGIHIADFTNAIRETAMQWARISAQLGRQLNIAPQRTDAGKALDKMVILLLSDASFEEARINAALPSNVVAYQSRVTQSFGTGPYMIVLKRSVPGLSRLVAHETFHALCDHVGVRSDKHDEPYLVWGAGGAEEATQAALASAWNE